MSISLQIFTIEKMKQPIYPLLGSVQYHNTNKLCNFNEVKAIVSINIVVHFRYKPALSTAGRPCGAREHIS
jgi:hypothetical protein